MQVLSVWIVLSITMMAISVMAEENNGPKGKTLLSCTSDKVSASSNYVDSYPVKPENLMDDNYSQDWSHGSCWASAQEVGPWWRVDLGGVYVIDLVKIWNRVDCCAERLATLVIEVSNDDKVYKELGRPQNPTAAIVEVNKAAIARYIRLRLSDPNPQIMNICEVEIWGSVKVSLVSQGKPSSQSSIYTGSYTVEPKNANDGTYSQDWDSQTCTHTDATADPWWQVDLGDVYFVESVKIWNRQDCCADRLATVVVEVSNDGKSGWVTMGKPPGNEATGSIVEVNSPVVGRVVRVRLDTKEGQYLNICEVEVWASGNALLASRGKPSKQSSIYTQSYPVDPKNANDGTYSQDWESKTCTHTDESINPWWQVDLGFRQTVRKVVIFNRMDCCADLMASVRVDFSKCGVTWKEGGSPSNPTAAVSVVYTAVQARYVRIILTSPSPTILNVCEVEVWTAA